MRRLGYIDIEFIECPFVELNLLRALVYRKKYNMRLSARLRNEIAHHKHGCPRFCDRLMELQKSHFGKLIFSRERLENILAEF